MAIYEYSSVPTKVANERCLAYRRAMADASDENEVISVLDEAAVDPMVSVVAFGFLCEYARRMLVVFRSVHSDK